MPGDPRPLLHLNAVSKSFGAGLFGRRRVQAVAGASLTLAPGETLALVGESGSGKSTLGRMVTRLIEPDDGDIQFDGQDVRALDAAGLRTLRGDIQMVFQDPMASLNPRAKIGTSLARPLQLHGLVTGQAEARAHSERLLDLVGMGPDTLDRFPHEFSGGQRQRLALARALAVEPKLLICDEPTSALDVSVQAQIITLLRRFQQELGLAQLFITHDLALVRSIADRVAVMYRGEIVEQAATGALFDAPSHPYTRRLLSSVPRLAQRSNQPAGTGTGMGLDDRIACFQEALAERFKSA